MLLIDGKEVSQIRREALKKKISEFESKSGRPPGLAVVLVGEDPASQVYVGGKEKACAQVGITSFRHNLPKETNAADLQSLLEQLNQDDKVDGILVQLPLPSQLSEEQVLETIEPLKDADGLSYENLGYLWAGRPRVAPCTPHGVMKLLEHYQIEVAGKQAVVIGRSNIVGKPMAQLLQQANATVTTCHSRTTNLEEYTKKADIVVVAAGKPRFIGKEAFQEGAVVIDVGIHRLPEGQEIEGPNGKKSKLCGDVRFEELAEYASAATPVPGGVGPMTITLLLENTLALAELRTQTNVAFREV